MELFKLFGTIAIRNGEANEKIDDTTDKAQKSGNKISSAFKAIGTAVATYFAFDKVKDFGMSCLDAAADANAASSQFSQVFGDMEKDAKKSLKGIADDTGIQVNRMKGSYTKIAAFAKTTGMSTEESLSLSNRALIAVADSAAFYDRSLEETTESLQSFLKGNYENDAALGLSCTETTRNAAANELYGTSFKNLSESQKQLTLLQMVEDANELSGALGQAARESDTWANQTGNLKQAWMDFKAQVGSKALEPAIKGVKKLAEMVNKATKMVNPAVNIMSNGFQTLRTWIGNAASYASDIFTPAFDNLRTIFGIVRDAVQPLIDKIISYVTNGQLAKDATDIFRFALETLATWATNVTNAVLAFSNWCIEHQATIESIAIKIGSFAAAFVLVNGAIKAWNIACGIATAVTSGFGAAVAFLTSPITLVTALIGALIAAGVLLYKNWDEVKAKCAELWASVVEKFEAIKTTVVNAVNQIKEWINKMKLVIPEIIATALQRAKDKAKEAKEKIVDWISKAKGTIPKVITNALDVAKNAAKSAKEKIVDWINNAKSKLPKVNVNILETMKSAVKGAVEKVKGFFNFSWSLPRPKLPRIVKTGEVNLGPVSVPTFGVEWHKKAMDNPILFREPTIFGVNPATGQMRGAGEAGDELMIGKETLLNMIKQAAREDAKDTEILQALLEILKWFTHGGFRSVLIDVLTNYVRFKVNDREVGRLVRTYA